ncbi:9700_t:CDS:2, partial [Acaulospora colombiana]
MNIANFLGISIDPINRNYLLVLEYSEENLRDYLLNHDLGWDEKIRIAKDIANGLNFIHNEINMSTKAIFLDNDKAFLLDPRIFSITTESSGYYNPPDESIAFVDPNVLKDPKINYTTESDIYSLGVIMWEISNRRVPFSDVKGHELLIERIQNNLQEETIPGTPQEYASLYRRCLLEPKMRPSILDVCKELGRML